MSSLRQPKGIYLLALPLLTLAGCGGNPTSTHSFPAAPAANWQIQIGTTITSPPTGSYILGDFQTVGSVITGAFTNTMPCSPSTSAYTGTTNSSGVITLNGASDDATILPPSAQYAMTTGTLYGGGYLCQLVGGGPAAAIEIPPFNGTYTGTLSASASSSGTATLTVTQDATPNTSGQFPVTATLQFTASGCASTTDLTGTINGTVVKLAATGLTLSAYDTAAGSTLPATLTFAASPCNAAPFSGTLTLQK